MIRESGPPEQLKMVALSCVDPWPRCTVCGVGSVNTELFAEVGYDYLPRMYGVRCLKCIGNFLTLDKYHRIGYDKESGRWIFNYGPFHYAALRTTHEYRRG